MENIQALLSDLTYWHWFSLAVILGITDVLIGANFILVWCGFVAAIVGVLLLAFPTMLWEYQFIIFGIGVFASIVVWRKFLKTRLNQTAKPNLNRRSQQYMNREFSLEEAIVNGRGKVKVDDSLWRVEGVDMPKGTLVKVTGVQGVVLKVEKVNQ